MLVFHDMERRYPITLGEFERRFPDDTACGAYLKTVRWPYGIECPRCNSRKGIEIRRNMWRCSECKYETSVMVGTIFQDSKIPLTLWFRTMWRMVSKKYGLSAMELQKFLELGSNKTAGMMLRKIRAAMGYPNRKRLSGTIEVDEIYYGAKKTLIAVAVEVNYYPDIGNIRLCHISDLSREVLHNFIAQTIEPGSTVITDDLQAYQELPGYTHLPHKVKRSRSKISALLPAVYQVASLLNQWLLNTHHGTISHDYLDGYLNEFAFRYNRRKYQSRGKLFFRLLQQAVRIDPRPASLFAQHKQ